VSPTVAEPGQINPVVNNGLRRFLINGRVGWGAHARGVDMRGSECRYIPVRRSPLFLEESMYRGLRWVVFEPNDKFLWSQIQLDVGVFMHDLFREGTFRGTSPHDAYLVKCDSETALQNDISQGLVNVVVGFAPLKPAEFVIIKIQQMAEQVQI
jgi:phage tail sheath protein FI